MCLCYPGAMKLDLALAFVVSSVAMACGSAPPADAKAAESTAPATPAAPGAAVSRPACIAIDEACDRYENESAKGKECHELGESPATSDAVCEQHKAECLAACPKK